MSVGQTFLSDFADDILVRCPDCSGCARLLGLANPDRPSIREGSRFVCLGCASFRDWSLRRSRSIPGPGAGPTLHGFELSLWLPRPCCGEVLWAYNARHLTFLQNYVAAPLRNRRPLKQVPLSNKSLESRLPRWMLSAKNRRTVLHGLKTLRDHLVADH
ncbi:MAG: hypothetical protein IT428_22595 [Planctomycetaceae bacterium]|nr:hypothetical protein [Planctomycetaceae bacterium]